MGGHPDVGRADDVKWLLEYGARISPSSPTQSPEVANPLDFVSAVATATFLGEFGMLAVLLQHQQRRQQQRYAWESSRRRVLHAFESDVEGELPCREDDILETRPMASAADWLLAREAKGPRTNGDAWGRVPSSYLGAATTRYVALHDFEPQDEHDLAVAKDDLVDTYELEGDDQWLEATQAHNDLHACAWGHVPKNYLEATVRFVVLRPAYPTKEGDLQLRRHDLVDVRITEAEGSSKYVRAAKVVDGAWGLVPRSALGPCEKFLAAAPQEEDQAATDFDVILRKYFQLSTDEAFAVDAGRVVGMGRDEIQRLAARLFKAYAKPVKEGASAAQQLSAEELTRLIDQELKLGKRYGDKFGQFFIMMFHRADTSNNHSIDLQEL